MEKHKAALDHQPTGGGDHHNVSGGSENHWGGTAGSGNPGIGYAGPGGYCGAGLFGGGQILQKRMRNRYGRTY